MGEVWALRSAEFITEERGISGLSLSQGAAQMVGGGTTPLRQGLQSLGQHLVSTKRLEWEPGPRWYLAGASTWQGSAGPLGARERPVGRSLAQRCRPQRAPLALAVTLAHRNVVR